ncbi:1-phosphatidylinositol 4, partial [Lamprotornis superbus]
IQMCTQMCTNPPTPSPTPCTLRTPSAPRPPGSPGLVPAGLTEDEDVQRMLQGSLLWKVKAKGGCRERLFRLQEDGVTVCFEGRFGRARSPQSFSVSHIEGVREGRQSEGLRKHGAAFPERHCFTLAFKGRRKNLDLAARGEEDARHWVQGLTKLMGRLQAMSQMEKLDHWIHGVLQRADRNKDNKMSFREVKSMLRMLNIDMDDVYASKLFKECDHSGNERLEGRELEEFCRRLLQRPELEELFGRYSGEDRVLSAEELQDFLRDQGEDSSLRQARTIIRTYELNEKAKQQDLMMLDGFMMYLLSAAGDILNQEHTKVHQDMSQPLSHYFISSSHNTYLTRNQIGGTSSTEAYVRALRAGCRCVELDCWEGSDGEPVVYHGHTLTSKILFRDVIESIRDSAFEGMGCWVPSARARCRCPVLSAARPHAQKSPYPVILSLENHCGLEQQATMARHMKAILGDRLLTQPLQGQDPHHLPSPEVATGTRLTPGWLPQAKDASQVSPELSALVVYCQAVPFPGLAQALSHPQPCQMSSFSERKARKLIKEAGPALVRYNARQLSRVYPLGLKMNSANYNPQEMWNAGCQLVALNFQTPGYEMDLNAGRFLPNGCCGYVLKPPCLRSPPGEGARRLALHIRVRTPHEPVPRPRWVPPPSLLGDTHDIPMPSQVPPNLLPVRCHLTSSGCHQPLSSQVPPMSLQGDANPMSSLVPLTHLLLGPSCSLCPGPQLSVPQVITAQQLPKLNRDKGSSIVDPFVRVEIHGIPADCAKQQTHHKLNNGFNPRWEETLRFQVRVPELALVRFVVEDYDSTSCNDFVGQFTLPLPSMRQGYRHIHLLSKDGASLSPATLFVHVRCKSL